MDKSEFESRYFDLVSKAPGKTFLFYGNLKEDMIRWSASAVEYFGLPGEIFGDSTREWISRIHPEDVEPYTDSLMELLHGVTPYHNCEYRIKNAQGEYVWVNCRGYMTYDGGWKSRVVWWSCHEYGISDKDRCSHESVDRSSVPE